MTLNTRISTEKFKYLESKPFIGAFRNFVFFGDSGLSRSGKQLLQSSGGTPSSDNSVSLEMIPFSGEKSNTFPGVSQSPNVHLEVPL